MVIKEIDVKHVNTHFKCYMLMNFMLIKMMFNFRRTHHKAMDKAYANSIINGVLSLLLKQLMLHYSHSVNLVK